MLDNLPEVRVEGFDKVVNEGEVSHHVVIWRDSEHKEKRGILSEYYPHFFISIHRQKVGALKISCSINTTLIESSEMTKPAIRAKNTKSIEFDAISVVTKYQP